ncbi:MFS transporter [Angustibacter sp. Root456]|uniref:MFS transporter n=1 Tax=Angustibacter sp. Root456 TaxID=1736539 RepID=UPI0012F95507|nr:MFS transporter [Angustibacter sp. Root456]
MPLTPYRRVLAVPGVRSLTLLGIAARIPHAATAVILTVHVVTTLGRGYGAAGFVVAAWTVGMALGAPWRGRAVDRLGLRTALIPSLVAEGAVWCTAPWLPFPALVATVVVGGALGLPTFTVVRLALSLMVPQAQRRTAFALDSVSVEVSFMVGPALGVLLATHASTALALVALGVSMVLAGVGLMALNPPTRSAERTAQDAADRHDGRARPKVGIPVTPALLAVLAAAAGATVVLAGTDVSIIASLRSTGELGWTGLVAAVWAFASLLGGVVYGLVPRSLPPFWLLFGLGALTVPVGLAHGPLALSLAMLPAGFLCAPVITATAEVLTALVPEAVRGEAMGWHGSALTVGTAVGAPLAGFAIDRGAASVGFATVGALGALLAAAGLAVVALRRRALA